MANVIVDKNKIDILANAISLKSGEPVTMTLDEMVEAVDGIEAYVEPTLQTKSVSYTPTTSAISDTVEADSGYDGLSAVNVTVSAVPASAFVVTLSYDSVNSIWTPNKTFAEILAAYNNNQEIVTEANTDDMVKGYYDPSTYAFVYMVAEGYGQPGQYQPYQVTSYSYNSSNTVSVIWSDIFRLPHGTKSITQNGNNIDVTDYAAVNVAVPGITPTGNINITSEGTTDVTNYATATVPEAEGTPYYDTEYNTYNGNRRWALNYGIEFTSGGWVEEGTFEDDTVYPAIPTGTSVTPTESAQTIGAADTMLEGPVTVNAIPSNYVGSGVPQKSSSDLTASGDTVSAPAGYYPNGASKAVQSGTEGTPTATKGPVSNHAVTVTPAVTNAAGYIQGGTHNGTPVTVSASELVSGSETKTQNGTYDVTNLAELVVNVSGGGGSSMMVSTATKTLAAAASSIQFTGLSGEPTSFVVTSAADQSTGGTKAVAVVYDGTSCHGIDLTTQAEADTGFTQSYSNGTLTITATTASFQANEYKLVYSYGGTGGNIGTADVQVGSGATSITFTGLSDEPEYFSCIFKSTFSTSSGYQRVMEVVYDGTNIYGHALDSAAHALTSWTWSYNNGSLTITSTGTNNGGYFHQPGYYQLTYAIGGDETLQTKTVTPTEQTQNVTADTALGYTALKKVVVDPIPSEYIIPTGNLPITQNGNNINVSQYATVSVNVSGGGSSMNAQSAQSTTRATSTSYTEVVALTCAASGTYDVYWSTFRSSTSGTWGSQLYIDNTAYGSAQTGSWSNHIQNIHLTNVQIDAGEEVAVRVRSRGSNYYGYVGTLTIIQKS